MAFVPGYGSGVGGVSAIIPGNGMTVSGPTSTPTLTNNGVLSIDGESGTLKIKTGQYYKTALQTLTSGNTDITFDVSAPWSEGASFTWVAGGKDFLCVEKGLYQLEANATIIANGASWTSTTSKTLNIDILRTPIAEQSIVVNSALIASGTNYGQCVSATIALEVGDVVNIRIGNTFAGGPAYIQPLQNTFDFNTTFTWTRLKPL